MDRAICVLLKTGTHNDLVRPLSINSNIGKHNIKPMDESKPLASEVEQHRDILEFWHKHRSWPGGNVQGLWSVYNSINNGTGYKLEQVTTCNGCMGRMLDELYKQLK